MINNIAKNSQMTSTTIKDILNALSDANAYRIFQRQEDFSYRGASSTEMSPNSCYAAMSSNEQTKKGEFNSKAHKTI